MKDELKEILVKAENQKKKTRKLISTLKKKKPNDLDPVTHQLHDEAFDQIDCLDCANCCKTTSPIFTVRDIERISHLFKLSHQGFIDKFLYMDEEGHYVLKTQPCPFLDPDNHCSIYESRPKACSEYPHTNRRKFHQALEITFHNSTICPAVFKIVEGLNRYYVST